MTAKDESNDVNKAYNAEGGDGVETVFRLFAESGVVP